MKRGKRFQNPSRKAPAKTEAPRAVTPSLPAGPPLEGEALELKVAEILCRRFRGTSDRAALREGSRNAGHVAIETAIVSPRVQSVVEPVMQAFALEQAIAVIGLLLLNAKAALESDKPTTAQVTALKIFVEILVERLFARVVGNTWAEALRELNFSDYEKSLIENLLQLVRGERMPAGERERTSEIER